MKKLKKSALVGVVFLLLVGCSSKSETPDVAAQPTESTSVTDAGSLEDLYALARDGYSPSYSEATNEDKATVFSLYVFNLYGSFLLSLHTEFFPYYTDSSDDLMLPLEKDGQTYLHLSDLAESFAGWDTAYMKTLEKESVAINDESLTAIVSSWVTMRDVINNLMKESLEPDFTKDKLIEYIKTVNEGVKL